MEEKKAKYDQPQLMNELIEFLKMKRYIDSDKDLTEVLSGGEMSGKDLIANLKQGKQKLKKSHVENLVKKWTELKLNPNYLLRGEGTITQHSPANEVSDKTSKENKEALLEMENRWLKAQNENLELKNEKLQRVINEVKRLINNLEL